MAVTQAKVAETDAPIMFQLTVASTAEAVTLLKLTVRFGLCGRVHAHTST